jgi:hypothetical protein
MPTPPARVTLLLSAALCSAFVLAGCSSSGGGSSSDTGATTDAASSSSSGSSTSLQSIVLQNGDLPTAWTGAAYKADPDDKAAQAALVQCDGGKDTSGDQTGVANSDDYSLDNATVSSSATSFKSQDDVDSDVATLKSDKISGCYEQVFKSKLSGSLPAGSVVNSTSVTITSGSNGGPSNVVATGTGKISVTAQGQTIDVYIDVAFITGKSIESEVDFSNVGAAVPADIQSAAIAKVAARTASA